MCEHSKHDYDMQQEYGERSEMSSMPSGQESSEYGTQQWEGDGSTVPRMRKRLAWRPPDHGATRGTWSRPTPRERAVFELYLDHGESAAPDVFAAAAGASELHERRSICRTGEHHGFCVDCTELCGWMCADPSRKRHRVAVERALDDADLDAGARLGLRQLPIGETAPVGCDTEDQRAELVASFLRWWDAVTAHETERVVRFRTGREFSRPCSEDAELVGRPACVGYAGRRGGGGREDEAVGQDSDPDVVVVVSCAPEWRRVSDSAEDVPVRLVQLVVVQAFLTHARVGVLYVERQGRRAVFKYLRDRRLDREIREAVNCWAAQHRRVVRGVVTAGAFFAAVVATAGIMRQVRSMVTERAARCLVPVSAVDS
jgi:hypothetical protein